MGVRQTALLLIAAIGLAACGELSSGQAGAPVPASPGVPATSTATGDCIALGQLPDRPAPLLAVADLGDGTQQVTSADGGYTIVVPRAWSVTGSHGGGIEQAFGQTHLSSFDRQKVQTPRPEAGWMLPPAVGMSLDVEVWQNPLREPLDRYATNVTIGPEQVAVIPDGPVTIGGRQALRLTVQDERRFQPATGPLLKTRQTRAVWLIPTAREDRVIVVAATPAESPLFPLAEQAMSTFRITVPVVASKPVTHQRSEILKQWTVGKDGPIAGRRVEAKLMTYVEANVAVNDPQKQPRGPRPMGIPRIDRDPDALYWLVAVSGPDLPQGRSGPFGAPSPAPTAWMLYTAAATSDSATGSVMQFASGSSGTAGTWPTAFDALPDRCR
jgi:hypothetical protein